MPAREARELTRKETAISEFDIRASDLCLCHSWDQNNMSSAKVVPSGRRIRQEPEARSYTKTGWNKMDRMEQVRSTKTEIRKNFCRKMNRHKNGKPDMAKKFTGKKN